MTFTPKETLEFIKKIEKQTRKKAIKNGKFEDNFIKYTEGEMFEIALQKDSKLLSYVVDNQFETNKEFKGLNFLWLYCNYEKVQKNVGYNIYLALAYDKSKWISLEYVVKDNCDFRKNGVSVINLRDIHNIKIFDECEYLTRNQIFTSSNETDMNISIDISKDRLKSIKFNNIGETKSRQGREFFGVANSVLKVVNLQNEKNKRGTILFKKLKNFANLFSNTVK